MTNINMYYLVYLNVYLNLNGKCMKYSIMYFELTASNTSMGVSSSPGTPPVNRTIMSSPFSVLTRPEHAFPHIHPQAHQVRMVFPH